MRNPIAAKKHFSERFNSLPYYFIAEIGLNHNGSVAIAHELIDVASNNGAQAVKLQKRTVEDLAINSVLNTNDNRFPSLGNTYREIRESHELSFVDFLELRDHAESIGLDFFVTPFDKQAVDFLSPLELVAIKVASHSVTNIPLLRYIANQKKQVIMSTGMSTLSEVDSAVEIFTDAKTPITLMHCVSSYPTENADLNLRIIPELAKRYNLAVGYSGHEKNSQATLLAFALGARVIERHITKSKHLEGFDHKLSLEPSELKSLIAQIEMAIQMLGSDKKELLTSEMRARDNYNVSMVSNRDIVIGEKLSEEMIVWKNPGTGIPPKEFENFLGKQISRNVKADELLSRDDFE